MTRDRQIIALVGLSGAGKTTLLDSISDKADFLHLSASTLIKEHVKLIEGKDCSSESLRKGDIPDNQRRFIDAFLHRTEGVNIDIVLDCHTVIDTPDGLRPIPASTFEEIGVTAFAFLEVESEELFNRRKADTKRERPSRTINELANQQKDILLATKSLAGSLGLTVTILKGLA